MTMVSQKVVLSGNRSEDVEFGPFTQGVVLELDRLIDVASGDIIAARTERGWTACLGSGATYPRAFVQTYPSDSPAHPPGGPERSLLAATKGRPITVHLSEAHERRLRTEMEDVDAQERACENGEPYERDDGGAFTDDTIRIAIRTAIERGLETMETERGVHARLDGAILPTEPKVDHLREALEAIRDLQGETGGDAVWAKERAREALLWFESGLCDRKRGGT